MAEFCPSMNSPISLPDKILEMTKIKTFSTRQIDCRSDKVVFSPNTIREKKLYFMGDTGVILSVRSIR